MKSQRLQCYDTRYALVSRHGQVSDFGVCRTALENNNDHTRISLVRQLDRLERAYKRRSPDAAAQARRLDEMVSFIESITQRPLAGGPAIGGLTESLRRVRSV